MKDLVKIFQYEIDYEEVNAVDARELWRKLESKQDFSTWIKSRIDYLDLAEGIDYIVLHKKMEANNATRIDYILTLDTAKHIAMAERNKMGKKVRLYFIQIEKEYRKRPKTTAEILLDNAKAFLAQERRLNAVEKELKQIKTAVGHFTVIGYASYKEISINLRQAQTIGKKASLICKELGIQTGTTPDQRFGRVKTYPEDILKEAFEDFLK
jgi:phage anti-repressor protein